MAKPYFTLNLDVADKPCLVIGGDAEALEKSERLVEAQARLTVVTKRAIPELVEFLKQHGAGLELREVTPADITGKFFVLNCVKTDPPLSQWIYEESLKQHAIISAYDQPKVSNAVMQALVRAGRMRIAISSGGASPGLASALRRSLEEVLDEDFVKFSESVMSQRECMIEKGATPSQRKHRFKQALSGFKMDARIEYPDYYQRNMKSGVEFRDGLWLRKETKGGFWAALRSKLKF